MLLHIEMDKGSIVPPLSKLERNSQKDPDDIRYLARSVLFNLDILQSRYDTEMRWQLV
jgi:hypothetical protein